MSYYSTYRWCAVPKCKNTSVKTPDKLWIQVPTDINMRKTWFKVAGRDPELLSEKTRLYLCEDHFDLEHDMENYIQYKIMGSVKRIRLKPHCIPSRFDLNSKHKSASNESRLAEAKRLRISISEDSVQDYLKEDNVKASSSCIEDSQTALDIPSIENECDKAAQVIQLQEHNIAHLDIKRATSIPPTVHRETPKKDLKNYYQHKLMNQEPRLKPTASLCYIEPNKSEDSTELTKLLLQHTTTRKPKKRKYEDTMMPSTSSYSTIPVKVCRVCLAMDVKMYDLKDIELKEMFQDITGIAVTENNHCILERLCWECAGRLKAAAAFRHKALLSDALLQRLANTGEQIRNNHITLIKEKEDYLKSARTLSIVEVFHIVEIDPENESLPSVSENNDLKLVCYTRKDSEELKESIIEENNDEMNVKDEPMIEVPIKTEIEYDSLCPNTGEENTNIVLETKDELMIEAPIKTELEYDSISPNSGEENRNIVLEKNPLFINNIPSREDTINSANSSPPPGCSHVEPKYPILGYLLKTPSDCEDKIKKLSNQKLVKKTQVKANTSTDEECLSLENFEF